MKTKTIKFETEESNEEMTFEQAFEYLRIMSDLFSVQLMANLMGINRTTLSASLHGTLDRRKKPNVLPHWHQQKVIDFVKAIQFGSVMAIKAKNGTNVPCKFSQLWEKRN